MEHMRKRNHREVNPTNNYYDKFYIINYLVFSTIFEFNLLQRSHFAGARQAMARGVGRRL